MHRSYVAFAAVGTVFLGLAAGWPVVAQRPGPEPGDPLPGLTADQRQAFLTGKEDFSETEEIEDGLGPVYNGTSCAECHAVPAVGGAGFDLELTRETLIGTMRNGVFDPLVERGGFVIQRRSVHEQDPTIPITGEVIPAEATLVSRRITTPLFGLGLVEAIPEKDIPRNADPDDRNHDGISGRANLIYNPETGRTEVGRFGWKAHIPTLHLFAGLAYLNEMGITNPTFPDELLPQGLPIPAGADLVPGLEDDGTSVANFATFMRLLAPLERRSVVPKDAGMVGEGEGVFERTGCAKCHIPSLQTGNSDIAALRFKQVNLYSDLLLHDMGAALGDGVPQGQATGSEFRTAPLWGLSRRSLYLHDGRASSLEEALQYHGGEASGVMREYSRLSRRQHDALFAFLNTL